jgi:hypothetical protein
MIAMIQSHQSEPAEPIWHGRFMDMMPTICRQAQIAFRSVRTELRAELVQEVVANCVAAYALLVRHGKEDVAYPSALARYAVAHVRAGRLVGNRRNSRDVMSQYAQHRKRFVVERLDSFNVEENCWQEIVVEDQRATPAEIAACRIDFAEWIRRLPCRQRRIAMTLATGVTTTAAARKFAVSPARISQIRQLLKESWERFQGEGEAGEPQLAVA